MTQHEFLLECNQQFRRENLRTVAYFKGNGAPKWMLADKIHLTAILGLSLALMAVCGFMLAR